MRSQDGLPAAPPAAVRLLMIGPLPPPVGGTRILFLQLTTLLRQRGDVIIEVIDRRPFRRAPLAGIWHFVRDGVSLMRNAARSDVITLHCSVGALPGVGFAVMLAARIVNKPLVIHTFGGTFFADLFSTVPRVLATRAVRGSALYLAEIKAVVEKARAVGFAQTRWFPNHRPKYAPARPREGKNQPAHCERFVFLGHVRSEKGINELVAAAERFRTEECVVDVYGPLGFDLSKHAFAACAVAHYAGPVHPREVMHVLSGYDCLVLPSHREGYPGVIIEAFCCGLPVICSDLPTLRELVDGSCGLLVPPHDADALHVAMALMRDPALYALLRRGAAERARRYDAHVWTARFLDWCRELRDCAHERP